MEKKQQKAGEMDFFIETSALAAFSHKTNLKEEKPMIKQSRITLVAALAAAGLALPGVSLAANATASSSSTVVTPITITKSADLAFGKFAAGTGGTVTVSTSGARTVSGTVVGMSSTTTAAKFDVAGETGATYTITLGGTTVLTSGSDTMAFASVSDLTGANTVAGNVTSGVLTAGTQSVYVGGVLTVGSAQAPGTYTGSVVATVEYN
jgi:hypothetical protein